MEIYSQIRCSCRKSCKFNLMCEIIALHDDIETSCTQDPRVRPQESCLEGEDAFGRYVGLNPRKADDIWMPDVFIDQASSTIII